MPQSPGSFKKTNSLGSSAQDSLPASIQRSIESFLSGEVLQAAANCVVEEVLFDQALRHNLVYDARNIAAELEDQGFLVTLLYCKSRALGHPVPFLVVRSDAGESVVPDVTTLHSELHGSELTVIECNSPLQFQNASNDDQVTAPRRGAVLVMPVSKAA